MATTQSLTLLKNFVGGEWRESSGRRVQDLNPADTSEVVAEAPASTAPEAAEAVAAAERAFEGWRNTPAPIRGQILYNVQRRMERISVFDLPTGLFRASALYAFQMLLDTTGPTALFGTHFVGS